MDFLDILIQIYIRSAILFFWFINYFKKKKTVSPPKDPILLKSATELAKLIRARKMKSLEIVEAYIKRIEEVNELVNAVALKNFEEARNQAKKIDEDIDAMNDEELAECAYKKPLLGLPFTVKDSICVQGKVITVGIYSRREKVAEKTAPAIQRMFDAGAILLAVTTVPEACCWTETNTYLHGRTRNPYDLRRISGGSSGGEGALHGAGASLMGVGSDVGGSIRIPSFINGIFGMMCSPNVVSDSGHLPDFPHVGHLGEMIRFGPITRFAEDLPLLKKVLSENNDEIHLERSKLENLRFYFAEGLTHYNRIAPLSMETKESLFKAVNHFENKYGKVAQSISFPETKEIYDIVYSSIWGDHKPFAANLLYDIENPTEPVNCTVELLKYIVGKSQYSLAGIIAGLAAPFQTYSPEKYAQLCEDRDRMIKRLEECLGTDGILFFPGWPHLPEFHNQTIAIQTTFIHTAFVNVLGMPAIQCPMGLTNGLPNGVTIIGNKGSDDILVEIAQEISKAFGGWVPPGKE